MKTTKSKLRKDAGIEQARLTAYEIFNNNSAVFGKDLQNLAGQFIVMQRENYFMHKRIEKMELKT